MAKVVGGMLRVVSTLFYFLEFCCSGIILGVYAYFLAKLNIHHLPEDDRWRAVAGLSGSAVLYTIFAVLLTCFLGGKPFFAFLAIVLNICFCGAMVAIAIITRDGDSCSGFVRTPLGDGFRDEEAAGTHLHFACKLNQVAFAVSIIAAFLFLASVLMQIFVARHHQKEKKYGPSPANNYTSGSGNRKFWQRRGGKTTRDAAIVGGAAGAGGGLAAHEKLDTRPSQETGYTGTTMTQADASAGTKYETHAGYHTGPTGTAVNPYGYQTQPTTTGTNY